MAQNRSGRTYCKLCHHNHWLNEPHIWDKTPEEVKGMVVDRPELTVAINIKVANKPILVVDKPTESRHGKYADLEKRKKYQREYKRKLRAKK